MSGASNRLRERAAKIRAVADDSRAPDGLRQTAGHKLALLEAEHGQLLAMQLPHQPSLGSRALGAKAAETWNMTTRQVADLIRTEIQQARQRRPRPRAAAASAALPAVPEPIRDAPKGTRITVTHKQFTGSSAININVHGLLREWAVAGSEEVWPGVFRDTPSRACQELDRALAAIGEAYNWRGDGFQQDMADCRFFFRVNMRLTDGTRLES